MSSIIKVDNIQDQCGSAVVTKCGSTVTLGASGDTIQLACGASQTGFGRTGTVDWDTTAKTAGFTAVSGVGYFVNTTSGAITMTLPATPSAGDIVSVKDYAYTFETNNLTVNRNGSPIGGGTDTDTIVYSTNGDFLTFIYVDGTKGWVLTNDSTNTDKTGAEFIVATGGCVTCCGDYKIHTFTGPGTFTVCSVGNPAGSTTVDYLVVAGGGSGGGNLGGGGGAGGARMSSGAASGCYTSSPLGACVSALPVTAQGYPITVGGGGAGVDGDQGNSGSNSVFSTITSAGGGGGGGRSPSNPSPDNNGLPGGSAGGGAADGGSGGTGNTPPVSPPQGQNGGGSTGGGGGAGAAGGFNPSPTVAGAGGNGVANSISSSPVTYAGGGGAGGVPGQFPGGSGGTGGGGAGSSSGDGTAGTADTGGGGGGGANELFYKGGSGGSGIVIIRYKYQ